MSGTKAGFQARVQNWLSQHPGATLSDFQSQVRRQASYEVCAANGYAGARATIERHGFENLYRLMLAQQRRCPSKPVRQLCAILVERLGLREGADFVREWEPIPGKLVAVDVGVPLLKRAVEVNGKPHYDGFFGDVEKRHMRQLDVIARLQRAGIETLVIDWRWLRDLDKVERLVREHLDIWS